MRVRLRVDQNTYQLVSKRLHRGQCPACEHNASDALRLQLVHAHARNHAPEAETRPAGAFVAGLDVHTIRIERAISFAPAQTELHMQHDARSRPAHAPERNTKCVAKRVEPMVRSTRALCGLE